MRPIDADALLKALNDYGLSYRADINGMIMQAPTIEPSGDLISRADAIECCQCHGSLDCINRIKALPSADAMHNGGVFVPNMEMPKACDYCLFHDSGWSWCKAKNKYCGDDKCPLIAVRGERND